ncbi:cryptochrome/photolyase family protein [Streptomyces youssoufiensis]
MRVSVVLFTADLRMHDHPPLRAALAGGGRVVPLFVRDSGIATAGFGAPNREAFLRDCLADLDAGLRSRGGRLVLRSGDVVEETCRVAAQVMAGEVHVSAGASGYAQHREERLRAALERDGRRLVVHEAVTTVLPPGAVSPSGGGSHFAVFTPYFRAWSRQAPRDPLPAPRAVRLPERSVASDRMPVRGGVRGLSPGLAVGGEKDGRRRMTAWLRDGLAGYEEGHDDLAGDATSRFSPHLHFGTLSPVELVARARKVGGPGAAAFERQLCWRDFHHQVLAARPETSSADYRPRGDRWRDAREQAAEDVAAWRSGRTGFPVVDAAMRQLAHEGWMHNRGRLLTASFLTKTLYVDWRVGARHFLDLLVDGDVANNQLNWQWVAGTGTDTRPGRVLNPVRQGRRYDPDGAYVRRWVRELADLPGPAVHEPWTLPAEERARYDYPDPIVDLAAGRDRFHRARARDRDQG